MYRALNKLSKYTCAFTYQKTLLHMIVCLLLNPLQLETKTCVTSATLCCPKFTSRHMAFFHGNSKPKFQ